MKSLVVRVGDFYGGYKTMLCHIFKQINLAKTLNMRTVWSLDEFYSWKNPHNSEEERRALIDTIKWENLLDSQEKVTNTVGIESIVNTYDDADSIKDKIANSDSDYFTHDVRKQLSYKYKAKILDAYDDMDKLLPGNFNIPNCKSYFNTNKKRVLVHIRRGDLSVLDLSKHKSMEQVPFKYYVPYEAKVTNSIQNIKGRSYYTIDQYLKEINKFEDCEIVVVSNNYKVIKRKEMARCCFIELDYETIKQIEREFEEYEFKPLRDKGITVHLSDEPDSLMRSLKSYFDCDVFIQGKDASMFRICKMVQEKEVVNLDDNL